MTSTHCLILCAGENERWGDYRGVARKHLVEVEGEVLLARTLAQVERFRPERTVVLVRPEDQSLYHPHLRPGMSLALLHRPSGPTTEAFKYLSSEPLWNREGRTVSLLGDVWFSDQAIATVFQHPGEDWVVFGRWGPSAVTGGRWGELFAHRFHDPSEHLAKLRDLDTRYREGRCLRRASGWAHYMLMVGGDPHKLRPGGRFVEIDDFTDDFDEPLDFDLWVEGRARAEGR